jgi:hypothetical protein
LLGGTLTGNDKANCRRRTFDSSYAYSKTRRSRGTSWDGMRVTSALRPGGRTTADSPLRDTEFGVYFGASNLFIPGKGCAYVAPSMIAHYIDKHRYEPPPEFWRAVLDCPIRSPMATKRHYLQTDLRARNGFERCLASK